MELKNRLQYLDKLISVQDMEVIKVVTGSNAYLLSSELSTYLSGRYAECLRWPRQHPVILFYPSRKVSAH